MNEWMKKKNLWAFGFGLAQENRIVFVAEDAGDMVETAAAAQLSALLHKDFTQATFSLNTIKALLLFSNHHQQL